MLNFLKTLLLFRAGQTTGRGMARLVGLGRLGLVFGLIGGIRAVRGHRRSMRTA